MSVKCGVLTCVFIMYIVVFYMSVLMIRCYVLCLTLFIACSSENLKESRNSCSIRTAETHF